MKLMSMGVLSFVLLLQQQNCEQRMQINGRLGVARAIETEFVPQIQRFFPRAQWLPDVTGDTRRVVIYTGVIGVSAEFLQLLAPQLSSQLSELQRRRGSLQGAFAVAAGAFPEQILLTFEKGADCGLPETASISLIYYVTNGTVSITPDLCRG